MHTPKWDQQQLQWKKRLYVVQSYLLSSFLARAFHIFPAYNDLIALVCVFILRIHHFNRIPNSMWFCCRFFGFAFMFIYIIFCSFHIFNSVDFSLSAVFVWIMLVFIRAWKYAFDVAISQTIKTIIKGILNYFVATRQNSQNI